MKQRTVADFMTRSVVTISRHATLAYAHRLMRSRRIRHLPVIDRKKLVGIVSMHDLHLLETLSGVDQDEATVDEAMTPSPYVVDTTTPLEDVAAAMVRKKLGSAVVTRKGTVVGPFTTIDALRALIPAKKQRNRR